MKNKFNWPGWLLKNNSLGKNFDLPARKRMLAGSLILNSYIKKYKKIFGKRILEIGPFFIPLITPKNYPNKEIHYWDNDIEVIDFLKSNINYKKTFPVYFNIDNLNCWKKITIKETAVPKNYFETVIVSQVLNYIDYKILIRQLNKYTKKGSLLFINNVINYGLPEYFSLNRPKSNSELIKYLERNGFVIIEKQLLESPYKKFQKNKRLILIAKKK